MAEKVTNRRLNIYIDQATAEQSLEKLTKRENELVAAIERQKKAGKDATKQMNDLADTRTRIGQLKDVMDGKLLPSMRMAEAAVQKINRELKQLPANSEAAGQKLQELRRAEETLLKVKNAAGGINSSLGDIAKSQGVLGKIQNGFGKLFGSGGLLAGGIIGGAALIGQTISFLSDSVDEALQANEAAARLRGTLDNLGRSDAFERLASQADAFAESVGYLDNDDIIGVFEQLITYGKLTEKQIMDLTPVIIDFAAKQRIQLPEAASAIIKALEGNGKALKEYGIDIKDAKDQTEAYKIIMEQLAPKVSGAAKTFSQELNGSIATTRQEIKNLKEDIGTQLLPIVDRFWKVVRDALGGLKALISDLSIVSDSDKFSFLDRLSYITGRADPELRARIETEKVLRKDKNEFDPVTGLNGYGQRYQPDSSEPLGSGDKPTPEELARLAEERRRVLEQLRRDNQKALKDFQDVKNKTQEVVEPILAAYRKVNDEANERIEKIKAALKRGLITPGEAREALDGVEKVLQRELDNLQTKKELQGRIDFTSYFDLDDEERRKRVREMIESLYQTGYEEATKLAPNKIPVKVQVVPSQQVQNQVNDAASKSSDPVGDWVRGNQDYFQAAFDTASSLNDAFLSLSNARSAAEDAALEKELANNERRKKSQQELLDKKVISQKEYDRRIASIDRQTEERQREIRKRQFERDKNAQVAQALMGAASAIVSTLAARPGSVDAVTFGILRAVQIAAITATAYAQVSAIKSAKPPQFEKGGLIPQGPLHSGGGIDLVDTRTGQRVGNMEGGEPILSRKTYAKNKPLIDALLAGSMAGSGLMSLNLPRIKSSFQTVYENGGFIPRASDGGSEDLLKAVNTLNTILSNPIIAEVYYNQIEAKGDRLNNIRSQSRVS